MKNIHYGQVIERIIRRNGYSITEIARLTNVNRRSVYNWFEQPRLKESIILSIGHAIKFDFATLIPELFANPIPDGIDKRQSESYWKDKYIALLEKYSELLTLTAEKELELL